MLRFDLPMVPAHVIRWEAFITCCLCLAALALTPWLLAVPALLGSVKGFVGHGKSPDHLLWRSLFTRLGWQGRMEDAGAKMFAAKVLALASTAGLALAASGSELWRVPATVLVLFSTLEWALGFCAGCWAYGLWYRRFPPA
jgi:Domain of unknown function (DUF4395)